MKKLNKLRRVRGLYVYQGRPGPDYGAYKLWAATSQPQAGGGTAGATKLDYLLLEELEETNNWARTGFQLYIGWFALQFIVNGVALGLLFNYRGTTPTFARLVFVVFMMWNLMGIIGAFLVRKSLRASELRVEEITKRLIEHDAEDDCFRPRSAVPRRAIDPVLIVCFVVSLMTLALWTFMLIRYSSWWPGL